MRNTHLVRLKLAAAIAVCLWSSAANSESFNINCSFADRSQVALLTVREALGGFLAPTISVVSGVTPGGTSPVKVEAYTANKIIVAISIELETYAHRDSELQITMDRNTGVAHFDFFGPREQTKTGVSYRTTVSMGDGRCERQVPRL